MPFEEQWGSGPSARFCSLPRLLSESNALQMQLLWLLCPPSQNGCQASEPLMEVDSENDPWPDYCMQTLKFTKAIWAKRRSWFCLHLPVESWQPWQMCTAIVFFVVRDEETQKYTVYEKQEWLHLRWQDSLTLACQCCASTWRLNAICVSHYND